MNDAWAVNHWSRGFTAQLSESWAYLSPYSAEQKKTHTLVSSFPRSFLYPPPSSSVPLPLWWMEGMNSPRPPWVSLWGPQQLYKQHALNLKAQSGIYLNCVRSGYICVWLWRRNMENGFCGVVITQRPDSFFFFLRFFLFKLCNCKQLFYELLLLSMLIYQKLR